MPVVSISLTDRNIEDIDRIQSAFGLKGRSEVVRACLRSAESELREREGLVGEVEGVLIIVHESHRSPNLDQIRHDHQDIISTQIHSHLRNEKCLEVFIINGDGDQVKEMILKFRGKDELEYVKFVPS
ncbi:MAG: CopG family ribbon-helix-helix protein [Thermoplasmatota archaeon]